MARVHFSSVAAFLKHIMWKNCQLDVEDDYAVVNVLVTTKCLCNSLDQLSQGGEYGNIAEIIAEWDEKIDKHRDYFSKSAQWGIDDKDCKFLKERLHTEHPSSDPTVQSLRFIAPHHLFVHSLFSSEIKVQILISPTFNPEDLLITFAKAILTDIVRAILKCFTYEHQLQKKSFPWVSPPPTCYSMSDIMRWSMYLALRILLFGSSLNLHVEFFVNKAKTVLDFIKRSTKAFPILEYCQCHTNRIEYRRSHFIMPCLQHLQQHFAILHKEPKSSALNPLSAVRPVFSPSLKALPNLKVRKTRAPNE
uniref:Uncharacterized protein n=1 Tax=Glossina pallidipes TaxID=7398 RepID=A0A1A9ZAM4_GLOPL